MDEDEKLPFVPVFMFTPTSRGFKIGEKQTDLNGTTYHIQESSLATEPAVRLYIDEPGPQMRNKDSIHLSLEQARKLSDDLRSLCRIHYQNEDN